jgi:protein tyrosine phosphatase
MPGTHNTTAPVLNTTPPVQQQADTYTAVQHVTPPVQQQPNISEEDRIARLSQEVERMQNLVSNLSSKTLGGQSPLEIKWKEVVASVEGNKAKHSVSVARCYPSKNKVPDVLPFDQNRVVLKGVKDDYINASRISGPVDKSCAYIITQAPSSKGMVDFWNMVWQEQVETMVCLATDHDYLPRDKDTITVDTGFIISVKSTKSYTNYVERVINITNSSSKQMRAMMAVQMVGWPGPDLPVSPACLLDTATATLGLTKQQRVPSRPVLVHCLEGGSKSATFLTIFWLVKEMDSLSGVHVPGVQGWPDISTKLGFIMMQRKGVVRDKQYLKLVYESLLYYMQDNLMKQGILNTGNTSVLSSKKTHSRHPSQDFVQLSVATLKEELNKVDDKELDGDKLVPSNDDVSKVDNNMVSVQSMFSLEQAHVGAGIEKNIPDDLSKLADITETAELKKNKKISKEDFLNPTSQVGRVDETDPLSKLDPLWSLK